MYTANYPAFYLQQPCLSLAPETRLRFWAHAALQRGKHCKSFNHCYKLGVLPNPKKSFQIAKSASEVKEIIEYIPFLGSKYKIFKSSPALNQITFEAPEFLSLGAYVDVNYCSQSDNRSDITIEVRRKIVTFNQSVEIQQANNHIVAFTELISRAAEIPSDVKTSTIETSILNKQQEEQERARKMQEAREKERGEKINHPVKYYSKVVMYILIIVGLIAGVVYMATKM